PAALLVKINQWSNAQDAWAISAVPPSSLVPTGTNVPANPLLGTVTSVQQAAGGVKFGANVVFSGEATADTAQNATTLADLVRFMINLAQMQGGQNPQAQALANSVTV